MPDRSACPHCHRLLHVKIFYDLSVIDDEEQADKGEASWHNAMPDGDQDEAGDQGEASWHSGDQDEAGDKGEDKGWDEALTIPEGPPEL
jgi:hypothetical protein